MALLVLSAVLIFLVLGHPILKAYGFRRHPRPSQAGDFFSSASPHKVPACLFLLKRGVPAYDHDLRARIYRPSAVKDTPWNRWMLRRDALSLRRNEIHLLARYPFPPEPALLPKIREALLAGEWSTLALLRQIDDERAEHLFREWTTYSLTGPGSTYAFLDSLPYVVEWPSAPLTGLLQRFWPQLSEEQRALALGTIARFLGESGAPPEALLAFLDQALARQEIPADGYALAVLGHFIARPATRERGLALLAREGSRILDLDAVESVITGLPPDNEEASLEPEAPPPLSQEQQAKNAVLIFQRMARNRPSLAVEALSIIAYFDVRSAEELARPILAGADSELRKSTIVILIGYESELGRRFLDQAFMGNVPLRTSFASVSDYIYGSRATEQYVQIAGHDYLEVGKNWPPVTLDPSGLEQEAGLWPAFIAEFPWFPGSDDAYYRLAYARYAAGGSEDAIETALEYFRRFGDSHPDRDAEPYLRFLVRIISYGNSNLPAHTDLVTHLRTLLGHPPGLFLLEESPELESYLVALDWFRLRETERRILGAEPEDLDRMRKLVAVARLPYGSRRLQRAAKVLEEEGASVSSLLYGRYPWLSEVQREEGLGEFAGESMREAVGRLTSQLSQAAAVEDVAHCRSLVDWLTIHEEAFSASYGSGFEREVFNPLFEQVEQARASGNLCPRMPIEETVE